MEPRQHSRARYAENYEAMQRLALGEKRVVIRAHWREANLEMDQVGFRHDFEAELEYYLAQYNQMVDALEAGYDNLPFFRVDFGRMAWLLSTAYGCEIIEVGKLLNTKPRFEDIQAASSVAPPRPAYEHGLYPEITKRMQEIERRFGDVPFVPSDTQSPIDVATQIVATEPFLMGMFDVPEKVHRLLSMITESIEEVLFHQRSLVTNWIGFGHDYPLPIGLHLSDDNAAFLSPATYKEFAVPTIERLAETYDGVTLHCCMGYEQNLDVMSRVKGFRGFDPQSGYNSDDAIVAAICGRGYRRVFTVPEGEEPYAYFAKTIERFADCAGLLLDVRGPDRDSALRLADQVRETAALHY